MVSNPKDELAFKRLARMLPGVGGKAAEKLWDGMVAGVKRGDGIAGMNAAPDVPPPIRPALAVSLARISGLVPKKAAASWAQFAATMSQIEAPAVRTKPGQMIALIVLAVYEDYLKEEFPNYRQRLEDVKQLAEFAERFQSLDEFLSQLALMTNVESSESSAAASRDQEQLKLSTVHQAKGLEFDIVFVIMLCDGMFPSGRSSESVDGEEEERRLFYVAVTRAKNELYLTYPLMRFTPGMTGDVFQQPSRFLGEIPKQLLEEWNLRPHNNSPF